MRSADKALGQLVGNVIILREQLPGEIESHRLRTMLPHRFRNGPGYPVNGLSPHHLTPPDLWLQQPVRILQRLLQGRALDAKPAAISRMQAIAPDIAGGGQHTAANTTVGAGGGNRVRWSVVVFHAVPRF